MSTEGDRTVTVQQTSKAIKLATACAIAGFICGVLILITAAGEPSNWKSIVAFTLIILNGLTLGVLKILRWWKHG